MPERLADLTVGAGRTPEARPCPVRSDSIAVSCGNVASEVVVHVTGELDMASTSVLAAALESHLHGITPGAVVAVDLSGVTFIDLHGVALLLTATETARSNGATFRVAGCGPRVHRLLQLTGTGAALNLE